MIKRFAILAALMVAGCTGAPSLNDPGKSARDFVAEKVRAVAVVANLNQQKTDCVVNETMKALNDDDVKTIDAGFKSGSTSSPALTAAASLAVQHCQ